MSEAEILYRDKDIIAVRKPAGMASQPDRSLGMDLLSWLRNTLARQEGSVPEILPVHRLDRPVGGVIVYAGNRSAAAKLSAQLTDGRMQKEYLAVLTGYPQGGSTVAPPPGTPEELPWQRLETQLEKEAAGNRSRTAASGGKKAILDYRILAEKETAQGPLVLVQIRLHTGRHHQIRVQMAGAGAGLWGDTKYNPAFIGKKGWYDLALVARRLTLQHPRSGKTMIFEVPAGSAITAHFPEAERG